MIFGPGFSKFLKALSSFEIEKGVSLLTEIEIKFKDVVTILSPYFRSKFGEQAKNCLPIVLYLILFLLFVFHGTISNPVGFSLGIICVLIGLMFFMEGLRLGLMPFAETIGNSLPQKARFSVLLGVAFLIGVGATLAEPAIGVLKELGYSVEANRVPALYDYLLNRSGILVAMVAIGVGVATVLGVMRFIWQWSLKILLIPVLVLTLGATAYAHLHPKLNAIIGLAWDCGGVTTGPVTVPLVLALGIGLSKARGASDTGMSGFGVVTLASLFPILFVLLGGIGLYAGSEGVLLGGAKVAVASNDNGNMVLSAFYYAVRAIVPLILFLYLVQRYLLKESFYNGSVIFLGIIFCIIGMFIFNLGLGLGLTPLGERVGLQAPFSFSPPEPLYGELGGKVIVLLFAFLLGYGATVAEPALNALGITVEGITQGAFRKFLLIHSVAFGVGIGISLGIAKIIWGLPLAYLLIPLYLLLIPLSIFSTEEFTNIGWDSAGVTTGPITVPLVLALGLGVSKATSALEGFGIISLASVCPIIVVLSLGLYIKRKLR